MPARDYESAPATQALGLDDVIRGLVSDLDDLRAGRISTTDAIARGLLAKQIFNGCRIYLTGMRDLSARAIEVAK